MKKGVWSLLWKWNKFSIWTAYNDPPPPDFLLVCSCSFLYYCSIAYTIAAGIFLLRILAEFLRQKGTCMCGVFQSWHIRSGTLFFPPPNACPSVSNFLLQSGLHFFMVVFQNSSKQFYLKVAAYPGVLPSELPNALALSVCLAFVLFFKLCAVLPCSLVEYSSLYCVWNLSQQFFHIC